MSTKPLALRIALRIVALASLLVPGGDRRLWRQEWEAELQHRAGRLAHRRQLNWRSAMNLIRRALGVFPDAAWLRRQFTADADAVHDAKYVIRGLAAKPGFATVALVVLAAGIGLTTAIGSLADALFARPLPVPGAERVVTVWQRNTTTGREREDVAPGNAISWIEQARSFRAIAAMEPWSLDYTEGEEPRNFPAARVTGGFFDAIGHPLLHGRAFLPEEFVKGGARAVILGHGMWRDHFGADPGIVGRTVRLDAEPHVVVGVLQPRIELRMFDNRREPGLLLPKYFEPYEPRIRGSGYWNVIARLEDGVTVAEAQAELDAISARLAAEFPKTNTGVVAQVVPLREHLAGSLRDVLPLLLGAAALVLLVACANVANLLLARGVARGREFAVRQALGAGRGRLFRQGMVEAVVLSVGGGAAGLLLARWSLDLIGRLRPADVAGIENIPLDARTAAIACALTLIAALAAGLAPAWQLARPAAATALREAAGGTGRRRAARGSLVVLEVTLATLLVVGAGLLVRSFVNIHGVDPGFRQQRVMALQVFAWDRHQTEERRSLFFQQSLERLRAVPGVETAGAVSAMPFIESNINIRGTVAVEGRAAAPARAVLGSASAPTEDDDTMVFLTVVAGDYFRTMDIPLDRGRAFQETDRAGTPMVALVTRRTAQKIWPGEDPIGAKVRFQFTGQVKVAEIVGIVGDVRHDSLDQPTRPELFLWHPQVPYGGMTFVVKSVSAGAVSINTLKEQVWAVDPLMPFYRTATVRELIDRTLVGRRLSLVVLGGFAVAALLLAAAGLYGVMSFSTTQRTREFGVRLALGARPRDITRMVLREGLRLAVAGVGLGLVVAIWVTRWLQEQLFGIGTTDPLTYAGVGILLIGVALASCYLPAQRAVRVDPLVALRAE
jgi:putative ABC transport system permease protein